MISRIELEKFGPPGYSLGQKEKDYVQHWLLSFLSRSGFPGVFKGGTCLQKAFGLSRYSEDLDFSLQDLPLPDFDALAAFLSSAGFAAVGWKTVENEGIAGGQGVASAGTKIRLRGPLYNGRVLSECVVSMDFSRREKVLFEPVPLVVNLPYPDLLPYSLRVMALDEIAAEKLRAMLYRTSSRDLFDLYFLLRKGAVLRKKLVDAKLAFYGGSFDPAFFEKRVEKLGSSYDAEMKALASSPVDYATARELVLQGVKKMKLRE